MNDLKEAIRKIVRKEMSTSAGAGGYMTPRAFKGKKGKNKALPTIRYINEASYRKFKKSVNRTTPTRQVNNSLRELKNRLKEIEQIIEFNNMLKLEMGEGKSKYWNKHVEKIQEMEASLGRIKKQFKSLR